MNLLKLIVAMMAFTSVALATDAVDCRLVSGWERDGQVRTFTADNLYEYLDGEAEGYVIYGLVRMQTATCKSGGQSIVVDLFEMTDAEAAYGLFSTHRDPNRPIVAIGMGGQVQPQQAIFSKDKYYVELKAYPNKGDGRVLQAFAQELEKRISGRTAPPDAIACFPTGGLKLVRLIPQSVLGVRWLERGYVAQYEFGRAFIVEERSPESASATMQKLREHYGQTTRRSVANEAFETKDAYLGTLCFFRKGRYIGGFSDLAEGKDPAALAKALAARIPAGQTRTSISPKSK